MSIENDTNLLKLQCAFPKLTEENQQYILGLAAGLKHAQNQVEKKKKSLFKKPIGNENEI
jgi:hypothetical protein